MPLGSAVGRRPSFQRYVCTKGLLAEGGDTPFTQHCRNYENTYRILQTEIQTLKDQVQDLYRDLTKHHSLINAGIIGDVLERSLLIHHQICSQYASVEKSRAGWKEERDQTLQRAINEQEIYEAQLHNLLQLQQENSYLATIARQIGPYILSIAKVKERLHPKFEDPAEQRDDRTETMLLIYADGSLTPDSEHRKLLEDQSSPTDNPLVQSEDGSPETNDCRWPGLQRDVPEPTNPVEMP